MSTEFEVHAAYVRGYQDGAKAQKEMILYICDVNSIVDSAINNAKKADDRFVKEAITVTAKEAVKLIDFGPPVGQDF